jgi:hypothetical protein
MQLGIETVVILIIAIVLLGSMIYFIKTLIKPDTVGNIFAEQLGCGKTTVPTEATPILPTDLSIQLGGLNDVGLCVKNTYGKSLTASQVHFLQCLNPSGVAVEGVTAFSVQSLPEDLARGEAKALAFKLGTTSSSEENLGTWLCRVQISQTTDAISDANPGIGPIQLVIEVD